MDSDTEPEFDPSLLELDASLLQASTPQKRLPLVERVCEYLAQQNSDTKSFLLAYLHSSNENIVRRKKQWGSVAKGWKSTEAVLDAIDDLVNQKPECRPKWNDWVLKKAKIIVAQQSPPQGSQYININTLDTSFFDHEKDVKRETDIVQSMDFLHQLITSKLEDSHAAWKSERKRRAERNTSADIDSNSSDLEFDSELESDSGSRSPSETSDQVGEVNESPSAYVYRRSKDKIENAKTRLKAIALTTIQMISYGCNRRSNGLQVENTITLLACGVSERVNQYLYRIGLSSCRKSALRGLLVLAKEKALTIKKKIKEAATFGFIICIDNIDMMERVHSLRIDATSKTYHGTWGYVHYLNPSLISGLNIHECTVASFQQYLKEDIEKVVKPAEFLPNQNDQNRWVLTLKNQAARVLLHYMKHKEKFKRVPVLNLPPIDQIKAEKPDIDMLKLMDSSDNGSDGIASLYDELIKQTGLLPEDFAKRLQMVEGDLGTCLNFSGLESQRVPSKHMDESLGHLIMIPGAGHTLWNISQAILLHHWGNPDDKTDLGAWRTVVELGGKKERPTAKKYFTSMIRTIEQAHEATLTACIFSVLGLPTGTVKEPIDLSVEDFESTIEKVFTHFLSGQVLRKARQKKDIKKVHLLLRIRDFATVIEANRAMSDGDIGRLLLMWKMWSVMAQGLSGLTHYSRYLPRLIRLLTKVLPKPLSHVILHTLLISPTGRPGHFVAKDFYLEVKNYWLKYFYNHAGPGTDIKRLKETYSLAVGFLADLVNKMKGRAGLNNIRQSHKNKSTPASMIRFLNMAKVEGILESTPNHVISGVPIPDINRLGIHKLQEDFVKKRLERFHWPLSSNYTQEVCEDGDNQEPEQRDGFGDLDEEFVRWISEE